MKNLTHREWQVIQLLAQGYTTRQTADKLFLAVDTIKTYRSRIMIKLNAKNAFQLGLLVGQSGYLNHSSKQNLKVV